MKKESMAIGILAATVIGIVLWKSKKAAAAEEQPFSYPYPEYMIDDPENRDLTGSSDGVGGVLIYDYSPRLGAPIHPVPRTEGETRRRVDGMQVDYPYNTGGSFLNPGVLPPVRTMKIQGGRYVNPNFLPPVHYYTLE